MKHPDTPVGAVLIRAKMSQREVATILRCTVLTAHRYVHGTNPTKLNQVRVDTVVKVLNALVDSQKLPLKFSSRGADRERRAAAIKKIQLHIDNIIRG